MTRTKGSTSSKTCEHCGHQHIIVRDDSVFNYIFDRVGVSRYDGKHTCFDADGNTLKIQPFYKDGVASVLPRQVGDYWRDVADERKSNGGPIFVWYVRTRTGTFVRQCEGDAAQLAKSAIKELLKHDRKKQQSYREQVEGIMEDMLADYVWEFQHGRPGHGGIQDVADEIAGWANDYIDGIKL